MEINYKNLFIKILTQEDLDEFSELVDFLIHSTYKMENDIQKATLNIPQKFAKTIEDYFDTLKKNRHEPMEFTNGLKDMLKVLDEMDKVIVTLAIEPDNKLIQDMSSWFYHNIDRKVILKYEIDKNIIAGMTITFNGRFKDYSYEKIFKQRLENINANL